MDKDKDRAVFRAYYDLNQAGCIDEAAQLLVNHIMRLPRRDVATNPATYQDRGESL